MPIGSALVQCYPGQRCQQCGFIQSIGSDRGEAITRAYIYVGISDVWIDQVGPEGYLAGLWISISAWRESLVIIFHIHE